MNDHTAFVTRDCTIPNLFGGEMEVDETTIFSTTEEGYVPVMDLDLGKAPLAISGNIAVGGKFYEHLYHMSGVNDVYVYERDSNGEWSQCPSITTNDVTTQAFSRVKSVALAGNVLAVTIQATSYSYAIYQAVYTYYYNGETWEIIQKFSSESLGFQTDDFGESIGFDGKLLAFAGLKNDNYFDDMGSLVENSSRMIIVQKLYEADKTWTPLESDLIVPNDDCGYALHVNLDIVNENEILVDCTESDDIFFYKKSSTEGNYLLQQRISIPLDDCCGDNFERGIAFENELIAVGTGNMVHFFEPFDGSGSDSWTEVGIIESPVESCSFGKSVAISGDKMFISSEFNVHTYILTKSSSTGDVENQSAIGPAITITSTSTSTSTHAISTIIHSTNPTETEPTSPAVDDHSSLGLSDSTSTTSTIHSTPNGDIESGTLSQNQNSNSNLRESDLENAINDSGTLLSLSQGMQSCLFGLVGLILL
ncbi:hypothetical protein ACHAXS_008162 [Conticribra weissflogii]